jgi:hypothetical protein
LYGPFGANPRSIGTQLDGTFLISLCEIKNCIHYKFALRIYMNYDLPRIILKKKPEKIEDYEFEDVEIQNYKSHPQIKSKMLA